MAMNPRNPHLWQCITCGSCYDDKFVICFRCFTHRPPPRSGYPQIFAGCVFHFNGIIQRSLLNQSFNKEWRMAQAHGATCTSHYVPKAKDTKVTHLIYRTGYERSDKVRAAVHSGKIHVVPIEWMLDSMMQGARVSEDTRSLKEIPSRSLPMDNSSYTLEHHRHAFYVAHQNNFPEPSPEAVAEAKALAQEEQRKRKPLGPEGHVMSTSLPTVDATRPYRPVEPWPLEELTQAGSGSVARPLFPGLRFLFSESCPQNAALCAQKLGATIVASLTDEPTHVLYTEEDKKNSVVQNTIAHIERQCATSSMSGTFRKSPFSITLAPLLWLQDCIQGYELLPNSGPYIASARLVPSYAKKK